MKLLLLLAFVAVGHCALLGTKKCTYGPSYWCSHIHHAKECGAVEHCMDTVWKKVPTAITGSTETCFDVINVLNAVRKSSDSDLLEKMAVGCTGLPAQKRAVCKELMTHDQDEVFQLLKSDLPSMGVASALGFCGSFPDTVPHPKVAGDYCTDCVNFFSDVRDIFNKTETQAAALLKQMVCARLGSLQDMCNSLVDQYLQIVYNILDQQMNPRDLCLLLQMCANQAHADIMNNIKQAMAKRQGGAETCTICQQVAKELQSALRDPTVQADILAVLKNEVCTLLPGDLATQCQTYVSEYGPVVFEILVTELDPKTICETIGLCNSTRKVSKMAAVPLGPALGSVRIMPPHHKDKTLPECFICKKILSFLIQEIGDNHTEAAIKAALDKVCSLLPPEDKATCDDLVNKYTDMIIKMLMNEMTPEAVCTAIGLCMTKPMPMEKPKEIVKGPEICLICEEVMGYLKAALQDPSNLKSIEKLLDEVCGKVAPSVYKGACEEIVQEGAPAIINLLAQEVDPVKICQSLGICSAMKSNKSQQPSQPLLFRPMMELQPARPHLLGSEKCTRGPSYWCASVQNAKECSVLEHCVKHYGLKQDEDA